MASGSLICERALSSWHLEKRGAGYRWKELALINTFYFINLKLRVHDLSVQVTASG